MQTELAQKYLAKDAKTFNLEWPELADLRRLLIVKVWPVNDCS